MSAVKGMTCELHHNNKKHTHTRTQQCTAVQYPYSVPTHKYTQRERNIRKRITGSRRPQR
jgi:hypothetical protein